MVEVAVSIFAIVRPGVLECLENMRFRLAQRARPAEYPRDIRSLEVMRSAVDLHDPSIEEKVVVTERRPLEKKSIVRWGFKICFTPGDTPDCGGGLLAAWECKQSTILPVLKAFTGSCSRWWLGRGRAGSEP
jgi:hypothetical protein